MKVLRKSNRKEPLIRLFFYEGDATNESNHFARKQRAYPFSNQSEKNDFAASRCAENWFQKKAWVKQVTVHERTGCVILQYSGSRKEVLAAIREFNLQEAQSQITLPLHSSRELNRKFQEKLVGKVVLKAASMLFLPKPLRIARIVWHMLPFLKRGIRCILRGKLKVDVLDALSIGISVFRKDFGTAGTVMFLLELGELLEEWTRKKSMEDLARCMALNVERVWLKTPESEVLTAVSEIRPGDQIVIRAGSMIPMDGILAEGEVTVNQASLTGESVPVVKHLGNTVYAGTVVEEGECVIEVKQAMGSSRYDQIVTMIEKSEQMKSAVESKAANLADKLVPYTFAGSILSFFADAQYIASFVGTHGRFLLCIKIFHAAGGTFCYERSRKRTYHCERR